MEITSYESFLRSRITELRIRKNVSEHKMSLDLDKSGAYIRSITSGAALPSVRELFNIIAYFDMTPAEFFAPTEDQDCLYHELCQRLRTLPEQDQQKVATLLEWLAK